jgi:DNA uptake protein ComE-like DNA-binding protein
MRNLMKEILFLKKGEQRALLVITILLVASLFFRLSISRQPSHEHLPDREFMAQIELLKRDLELLNKTRNEQKHHSFQAVVTLSPHTFDPHTFDPNTESSKELMVMGFSNRVVSNLVGYREAGGVFYKPEDLRKIYGMDSLSYHTFLDYIVIERETSKQVQSSDETRIHHTEDPTNRKGKQYHDAVAEREERYKPENKIVVELNSADSLELIRINGIGPVFSSRIIRYRVLLGGFYSQEQLWEVYGMDSLKYKMLTISSYIDTTLIRRHDLNEVSFSSLVRHPYFTRQEVSDLIHYRNYTGEIKELTELKANLVIDSLGYEKMKHYLKCEIREY